MVEERLGLGGTDLEGYYAEAYSDHSKFMGMDECRIETAHHLLATIKDSLPDDIGNSLWWKC